MESQLEASYIQKNDLEKRREEAVNGQEISEVRNDLLRLSEKQSDLYYQLNKLPQPSGYVVEDFHRWKRFETTQQILLRSFRTGELVVECILGMSVNAVLWKDLPDGFGYDWELSLIFLPETESAKRINSGRINKDKFDVWVKKIKPIIVIEEDLTEEEKAYEWFRAEVENWDGKTKKTQFREMALIRFPISRRYFDNRIWPDLATAEMTSPGPKN